MSILPAARTFVALTATAGLVGAFSALPAAAALPDTTSGSVGGGRFYCRTIHKWTTTQVLAARCKVSDVSKDGVGVYLQAKGVRSGATPDSAWGRLTQNAPSQSSLRGNFALAPKGGSGAFSYYLVRICQSRAGVSDPCGAAHVLAD